MHTITSSAGLKEAIQILEAEQAIKGQELKQQFHLTYESLKPANLFMSTLNDITSSAGIMDKVLGTTAGLFSGFLSKKLFVGNSGNLFRKLLGSLIQFGVSNLVASHPEAIKTFGQFILSHINRKKEAKHSDRRK
jgi:hypothetical protein